jgi:uncharacterized iron-regulated protein
MPENNSQYDAMLEKVALSSKNLGGALWLGEHHNARSDHEIQLEMIQHIDKIRRRTSQNQNNNNNNKNPMTTKSNLAIGLEQVQIQFQPVLDDYINGIISSTNDLRKYVQWDTRWVWSFDLYEPIFRYAQQNKIPLIALNVNSEDLVLVQKYGLPGLSSDRLREYITDAYVILTSTLDAFYRRELGVRKSIIA